MDTLELKNKAFSGMFWKLLEHIGAQGVSLVVSIILARLLSVTDYSVVGIVSVFFAFCNVFITGGFNAALIQKKNADSEDYSSVLCISLMVAGVLYLVLFLVSPWLAQLYSKPLLVSVFRVMGLTLVVDAVKSVLCAYISNKLAFRSFFFATTTGTCFSAVVGIVMALNGFGPWALVAQRLSNSIINTLALLVLTKYKISFRLSKNRVKGLFGYGWKIFVASTISTVYENVIPLVIGLKFSAEDLSFYTKGQSFPSLLSSSVSGTFSSVLFPVMSKVQEDGETILRYTRKFMSVASYVVFPMMIGFLAVSDNFVKVFLTEKWLPASVYIKIFCVTYMFNIVQNGNLQTIRAIGRSDIILKLEIIKKVLYFVVIFAAVLVFDEPAFLAAATVINTVIATAVNTAPNRKLIGYKLKNQCMDLLPNLLLSCAMGVVVFAMNRLAIHTAALLVLQIAVGGLVYIGMSVVFKNPSFWYLWHVLRSYITKNR